MLLVLTWEYKACKLEQSSANPGVRAGFYLHSLSNFLEFREKTKSKMYGGAVYRQY